MPVSKYFKGHGTKVMKDMKKRYGEKKGESVFYATANKRSMHGSAAFSEKDRAKGYKVIATSSELERLAEAMPDRQGTECPDYRVDPRKKQSRRSY